VTGFVRKNIRQLFEDIPFPAIYPDDLPVVDVTGIVQDSRRVEPRHVFVAVTGENYDGHNFIQDAIDRGAAAVVGSKPISDLAVPYIQVDNPRKTLAYLAASFYNFPARNLTVIGVTGTDGKTTTSNLIYEILLSAGYWPGMVSTVNAIIGDDTEDTGFHVTTPEASDVQRYLSRMVAAGLSHAVLESTSHGLAQQRVAGCEFDIGVITNVTHEHLDYHGSYEAYRESKAILIKSLAETAEKPHGNPRLAVLNRDDQSYEFLSRITPVGQVCYSRNPGEADIWAEHIRHDASGLHFTACTQAMRVEINSNLVGDYNVSNILAALGATVLGLGVNPRMAALGVTNLHAIPGRMERINVGQEFLTLVDFAHTPNALKNVLQTVRTMTEGRVIAVFGSAGLRDRQKRRMMADISIELADTTVLTAEDPRTEELGDILAEMAATAEEKGGEEGRNFFRIPDRGKAILHAVQMAQPGDTVIVCGKGHEQSMCFGEIEFPWDDRVAVRAALSRHLHVTGPPMPYLPTQEQD
jgi:UDP-N-acetylmuramoyl-L-alanyl-D-glutamate--2,6-diaminopimelate ligase